MLFETARLRRGIGKHPVPTANTDGAQGLKDRKIKQVG